MARTALESVTQSYTFPTSHLRFRGSPALAYSPDRENFGNKLSDINGRQRWDLAGCVLESWNGWVASHIEEIVQDNWTKIRKNHRFTDEEIFHHCWMIGKDIEHARPTIVISSNVKAILDRAAKFIRRDRRIKESRFALMGVLNAMLTLLESRDGVHILPHTPTYNAPVHGGFRARRILIDRAQSQATIGGTIIVGERTYGLTAGHPFHDTDARRRPPSAVPEFFDYDLDSVLSDSDSDCGSGEDRSTGSDGTLEHTASGRTSSVTLRQWEYADLQKSAGPSSSWDSIPDSSVVLADLDGGDWALVPLDHLGYHCAVNELPRDLRDEKGTFIQHIATKVTSGGVFALLVPDPLHGFASASACSVKIRGNHSYNKMWAISLKKEVSPGDSGAWVVEAATLKLYGSLIAKCSPLGMAYVMPAITGVARIREQEKVETVRLPTVLDTVRVVLSDSGSLLLDAGVCKEVFRGNELDAIAEFERLLDLAAENGLWYHSERLCEGFSASHERSHYDPFLYALYAAARKGSVRGLDILVDMVGWIDAKDSEGRTALFWAASEGHPEVVTLLHLRGADINTTNRCGSTPLLWAASEGNLAVVKSLLDRGADVNLANSDKSTPLLWAASEGHEKIVMLLLIEGAEVNAANLDEWTPLLWAARGGYTGIVDLLLKNQALVNCRNSDGSTPLMWAASQGHEDVVRLLLAHGADISLRDNLGWDALSLAARKGYKAVEAQLKNRPKGALISPAKGMDLQPKKIRTGEHSVKGGKREHLQVATVPARIHLPR